MTATTLEGMDVLPIARKNVVIIAQTARHCRWICVKHFVVILSVLTRKPVMMATPMREMAVARHVT